MSGFNLPLVLFVVIYIAFGVGTYWAVELLIPNSL